MPPLPLDLKVNALKSVCHNKWEDLTSEFLCTENFNQFKDYNQLKVFNLAVITHNLGKIPFPPFKVLKTFSIVYLCIFLDLLISSNLFVNQKTISYVYICFIITFKMIGSS